MGEMSELFLGFSASDMFCRDLDATMRGKPFVSEDTDYNDSLPLKPTITDLYESVDTPLLNRYAVQNAISTNTKKKGKVNTMANIWDEFDKAIDTEGLAKDVEEAAENGGRREVPHDTYEVAVTKLELVKSKKGDPMVTCWMKILEGEYKGSLIFMNQVVTQGFQIHIANEFMRALVAEMADPIDVQFKTYNQYGNMIMDVMEAIDNNFEYQLDYRENSKGYNEFEIKEVYVLED